MSRYIVTHHHLHPNNSTKQVRMNSKYMTIAHVYDTKNDDIVGTGIARCHKKDAVNKLIGRTLARERALEAAFGVQVK